MGWGPGVTTDFVVPSDAHNSPSIVLVGGEDVPAELVDFYGLTAQSAALLVRFNDTTYFYIVTPASNLGVAMGTVTFNGAFQVAELWQIYQTSVPPPALATVDTSLSFSTDKAFVFGSSTTMSFLSGAVLRAVTGALFNMDNAGQLTQFSSGKRYIPVTGTISATTDATGFITFNHGLGSTPTAVIVEPQSPIAGTVFSQHVVDTIGGTTARIRCIGNLGSAIATTAVVFRYAAYAL